MRVGADNKRQILEIADSVSQTDRQFLADIVGGLEKLVLLHVAAKEDKLAECDGVDGLLDIWVQDPVLVKVLRAVESP